ncbi:MAG: hypothetical protein JF612_08440 [Planctomycetia bacterium]|nr:hypothetical protein [Planctomycetia bacterium]
MHFPIASYDPRGRLAPDLNLTVGAHRDSGFGIREPRQSSSRRRLAAVVIVGVAAGGGWLGWNGTHLDGEVTRAAQSFAQSVAQSSMAALKPSSSPVSTISAPPTNSTSPNVTQVMSDAAAATASTASPVGTKQIDQPVSTAGIVNRPLSGDNERPSAIIYRSNVVDRPNIADRQSSIVDRPSSVVARESAIVDRPSSTVVDRPANNVDRPSSAVAPAVVPTSAPTLTPAPSAPAPAVASRPAESAPPAPLPSLTARPLASNTPMSDEPAVRNVLAEFQAAYERLDAAAAKELWPAVDERALGRAFSNLESQTVSFDSCRIHMGASSALAYCSGPATYVGRTGNKTQSKRLDWTFALEKAPNGWQIQTVQTR